MFKRILFVVSSLLLLSLVLYAYRTSTRNVKNDPLEVVSSEEKPMKITSSVFEHQGNIPKQYTCDGEDISPPLSFINIPAGTRSLALIVDDPDAPAKTWVHWVVFNIPPETDEITQNTIPVKAQEGITDFQNIGYGGPCPPSGTHRYFFKLYALDTILQLDSGASKEEVLSAMRGHILQQAELVGLYP
jgi:hypothetical protein